MLWCRCVALRRQTTDQPKEEEEEDETKGRGDCRLSFAHRIASQKSFAAWLMPRLNNNSNDDDDDDVDTMKLEFVQVLVVVGS